jgi:DNA-binding CsgD family transcriptional regulator
MTPLLHALPAEAFIGIDSEKQLFGKISEIAQELGARCCAYGIRMPFPLSRRPVALFNDYPSKWKLLLPTPDSFDVGAGMLQASSAGMPDLLALPLRPRIERPDTIPLYECAWGVRHHCGAAALLIVLVDARLALDEAAAPQRQALAELAQWAHPAMGRLLMATLTPEAEAAITVREKEVLTWTADGKSVHEISRILQLKESTVNFHVRNAMAKLDASNRTHAAVKAALLGLLY